MTQPELGEALGLSQNQVSRFERGMYLPPPDSVIREWAQATTCDDRLAELIELARQLLRPVQVEPD